MLLKMCRMVFSVLTRTCKAAMLVKIVSHLSPDGDLGGVGEDL